MKRQIMVFALKHKHNMVIFWLKSVTSSGIKYAAMVARAKAVTFTIKRLAELKVELAISK